MEGLLSTGPTRLVLLYFATATTVQEGCFLPPGLGSDAALTPSRPPLGKATGENITDIGSLPLHGSFLTSAGYTNLAQDTTNGFLPPVLQMPCTVLCRVFCSPSNQFKLLVKDIF